jgi:hypothetical protein
MESTGITVTNVQGRFLHTISKNCDTVFWLNEFGTGVQTLFVNVSHVEQELPALPDHLRSSPVFIGFMLFEH